MASLTLIATRILGYIKLLFSNIKKWIFKLMIAVQLMISLLTIKPDMQNLNHRSLTDLLSSTSQALASLTFLLFHFWNSPAFTRIRLKKHGMIDWSYSSITLSLLSHYANKKKMTNWMMDFGIEQCFARMKLFIILDSFNLIRMMQC